jgi:hypothetical protein
MEEVFIVFEEISYQTGEWRIFCVCKSKERAIFEKNKIIKKRSLVKEFQIKE